MQADLDAAITELALASGQSAPATRAAALGVDVPAPTDGQWPREALGLLERAEDRLRAGDFQGFGEALTELKVLLERLSADSSGG